MARPSPHPALARYAAPAAFLVAVTVAVLLIRAGLGGGSAPATTLGPVTHPATAPVPSATAQTITSARTSGTVAGAQYAIVRSGDTFGSIAAKEGVSVAQLEQLNPGVSSNSLQVGQRLRVK